MSLVLPPEDDTFKCLAVRHVHRAEARAERYEDLLEGDVVYQIKRGQPRRLSREALQFRVFAQVYRCKTAALYEAEYRQFGILAQVKGRDAGVTYIEIGQFGQGRETCRGDACVVADIQVGDVHAVLQSGKVGNVAAGAVERCDGPGLGEADSAVAVGVVSIVIHILAKHKRPQIGIGEPDKVESQFTLETQRLDFAGLNGESGFACIDGAELVVRVGDDELGVCACRKGDEEVFAALDALRGRASEGVGGLTASCRSAGHGDALHALAGLCEVELQKAAGDAEMQRVGRGSRGHREVAGCGAVDLGGEGCRAVGGGISHAARSKSTTRLIGKCGFAVGDGTD